jgi:hypothetical protein
MFMAVRVVLLGWVPKRSLALKVALDSRERSTYMVNEGSARQRMNDDGRSS